MSNQDWDTSSSGDSTASGNPPDVVTEFDSFAELLDRCASKLSEEGVQVAALTGLPAGTRMQFHLRIRDGFSVLKGEGEVVWSKDETALRFVELDEPSLRLLPKLMEHYRRRGVPPLDLSVPETGIAEIEGKPRIFPVIESAKEPQSELTLDDLEAEFRVPEAAIPADPEAEAELTEVGGQASNAPTTDADLLAAEELTSSVEMDSEVDFEVPGAPASPQEIRFEDLLTAPGEAAAAEPTGEPSDEAAATEFSAVEPADQAAVDAGLPWLQDEPKKRGGDLWIFLVLALLGALLGAAFYFFVMRNGESGGDLEPTTNSSTLAAEELKVPLSTPAITGEPVLAAQQQTAEQPAERQTPLAVAKPDLAVQPISGVDRITWGEDQGKTVVTLWADGRFEEESIDAYRVVAGPPRQVVMISGISRPCPEQQLDVGTGHVRRIRTGLHEADGTTVLHVVADLVDERVEMLGTEASGAQLKVYFSRAG